MTMSEHPNECIEFLDRWRLSGHSSHLWGHEKVRAGFKKLWTASSRENPIIKHFRKHLEDIAPDDPEAGVTEGELLGWALYLLWRTQTTPGDLAAQAFLQSLAKSFGLAGITFRNLHDEFNGQKQQKKSSLQEYFVLARQGRGVAQDGDEKSHSDFLYQSLNEVARVFLPDPFNSCSFRLAELIMRIRHETGRSDFGRSIADQVELLQKYSDEHVLQDFIFDYMQVQPDIYDPLNNVKSRSFDFYIERALYIVDNSPPDSDRYNREIIRLTAKAAQEPTLQANLCAGAVRSAVREAESADKNGVIMAFSTVTNNLRGYFPREAFKRIRRWPDLHIGHEGVEDRHKEEAILMAYYLMKGMASPVDLAAVFEQEADLIECRNQQAADSCLNIERARMAPDAGPLYKPRRKPPSILQSIRSILFTNLYGNVEIFNNLVRERETVQKAEEEIFAFHSRALMRRQAMREAETQDRHLLSR